MVNLLNLLRKHHTYKYVEPCPICSSRCTGRYIQEPITRGDMEYIELQSLKHGEIVRFAYRIPEENVFCVDCGHRWTADPKTVFLSKDELMEEIEARGTQPAYEELRDELEEKRGQK